MWSLEKMANLFSLILLSCATLICSYPLLQSDVQSSQVKTLYRRSTTGLTNFMLQTLWTIVNKNSESRRRELLSDGEEGSMEGKTGRPGRRTPGGFERRGPAGTPHSIRCYFNAVSCFY